MRKSGGLMDWSTSRNHTSALSLRPAVQPPVHPCTCPCGERQFDQAPRDGSYGNGCCNEARKQHSPLHPGPDEKPNTKARDDAGATGARKGEFESNRQPDRKDAKEQQLEHSLCRDERGWLRKRKAQKQIGPFVSEYHQIQKCFTGDDYDSGNNA